MYRMRSTSQARIARRQTSVQLGSGSFQGRGAASEVVASAVRTWRIVAGSRGGTDPEQVELGGQLRSSETIGLPCLRAGTAQRERPRAMRPARHQWRLRGHHAQT